jgi:hypothetical protein
MNDQELNNLKETLPNKEIREIASIISNDWKNVQYTAIGYLQGMFTLVNITDNYYNDSGSGTVAYFLSNATSWKGDVARLVKKELNKRLKNYYKS